MSEMKSLGKLGEDVIDKLKKAKLMTIIRGTEVWVDESDLAKARKLMDQEPKSPEKLKSKENPYKFHGYIIRTPEALKLSNSYVGGMSGKSGTPGNHAILEFAKPSDGLDLSVNRKQIATVTINGTQIPMNVTAFTPAYSGIVMNDDNGVPLFEISPYNVFVLFDTRSNPEAACKVYEKLLIFCVMLSEADDVKARDYYDKIWQRQSPIREKYEIQQFKDMFMGGIKQEIKKLQDAIGKEEQNIKSYETELFRSVRAQADAETKLHALSESGEKTIEKRATEEWEKVKSFEKTGAVSNVRITPTTLAFRTRMISWLPKSDGEYNCGEDAYAKVKRGERIEFGEYEVTVNIAGDFRTTIKNMTKTLPYLSTNWHHPHIKQDHLCMGNMTETIPKFVGRREFEAIMVCFLRWLETVVTTDTYGQNIGFWIRDHQIREIKRKEQEAMKAEAEAKAAKAKEAQAVKSLKDEPVLVESKQVVRFVTEE